MLAYALTIFTGAFLLFQVQPLMGKYILPWFGGGPGVWTTCMLFFQVLLLGGYAYAHLISRYVKPRRQAVVHLFLLIAALALLPITPNDALKPTGDGNPTWEILWLLAASLGLPYLVLSSTGPLMQQWFSRTNPGVSPYRLYALSNVGSLLALVSYPFFFESHLTRQAQAGLWSWGLVVFVIGCGYCALKLWRATPADSHEPGRAELLLRPDIGAVRQHRPTTGSVRFMAGEQVSKEQVAPDGHQVAVPSADAGEIPLATHPSEIEAPPPPRLQMLLWLLLPACASVLLLATTNKLCLDVAVIPFLWVLPLALYLLSFILCFDNPRWYSRFFFTFALIAALGGLGWALYEGSDASIRRQVAIYCGGLFVCCMACHGELYRIRPDPRQLTAFYLMIAAGGALGGLFVAVIAPAIFLDYYELHVGLFGCGLLFTTVLARDRDPRHERLWRWLACLLPFVLFGGLDWYLVPLSGHYSVIPKGYFLGLRIAMWLMLVLVVAWVWRKPFRNRQVWRIMVSVWLSLGVVALGIALWKQAAKSDRDSVYRSRNFYGLLTVLEYRQDEPEGHHFLLKHGRITHGIQFVDPTQAQWPTTYYGQKSGVGLAMRALPEGAKRIGLVGLGTGTMAAYGHAGDYVRFYEINPAVKRLATSRFTYLTNCASKVDVVLGDARLSMERESPQGFDLLALDAFSSDAIPVHLLTKEAFDIYERHLKPGGIIAVHISNHFLDLEPVVLNLARHFNYQVANISYDENDDEWWEYSCTWILLTHNKDILNSQSIREATSAVSTNSVKIPLWTDDFASLFQILK